MRVLRLAGAVAAALFVGSCPGAMTLVSTQAFSGSENGLAVLALFVVGWAVAYGLGAMAALAVMNADQPVVLAAGRCGAIGGGLSGFLIAWMAASGNLGGSPAAVTLDYGIVLFLPWIIAWAFWLATREAPDRAEKPK